RDRMSSSAAVDSVWSARGRLIRALFFVTPLFTAASPRLTPFFLPVIAILLIGSAIRCGLSWRELLKPNPALGALPAVAFYAGLSAIWAADPEMAVTKGALLLTTALTAFAATAAIRTLDEEQVRRALLAFVAGSLCGAAFVLTELLTDGAITRAVMNTITAFRPSRPKHVAI